MNRRLVLALFALGALARLIVLPLPGTPDVPVWKSWAFAGATDATGLYGVGGSPPERRVLRWGELGSTTEYPPLGLYEVAAVGRAYRAIDPRFGDGPLLTTFIKIPGLLAEGAFVIVLLTWGRRLMGDAAATWAAVAFWLNPGVWLDGAVLGYLDAQMAVPAALAFLAAFAGRPFLAGVLIAMAVATKAQALFVLPVLGLALARPDGRWRWDLAGRAAAGGGLTLAAILLPLAARGALPNFVQAVERLGHHDMVSGNAANFWWVVTWLTRVAHAVGEDGWLDSIAMHTRLLKNSQMIELGYPDPKLIGVVLVLAAIGWAMWRGWRGLTRVQALTLAAWTVFAYSMFNAQVHENHLYAALPLFALAAAENVRLRRLYWLTSVVFALNIHLFYGLGEGGWRPLVSRSWTFVDTSVVLAVVNLVLFATLTAHVRRPSTLPSSQASRLRTPSP